jgi:hypothetical protein
MKYHCRIFRISVAKFSKKSQIATNAMGSVSPALVKYSILLKHLFRKNLGIVIMST